MTTPAARLVERFYREVWNQADEALAHELLHPGFAFRGSLGPRAEGPEGFIFYMRSIHAALAGYTCTIEELITEGTRAAARVRFAGTHRGTLLGVAATGCEIAWIGAAFFETNGQQITSAWILGDLDGLKRQLGLHASG